MIAKRGYQTFGVVLMGVAVGVVACSSGSSSLASKYVKTATVGAAGATITVNSTDDVSLAGTTITIPKGALASDTAISIGISTDSVVQKGSTAKAIGPVVDFEPSGTKFAVPVTITLPATLPSGVAASQVFVEAVEADHSASALKATYAGGLATFQANGFTDFGALLNPSSITPGDLCSTDADCGAGTSCIDGHCESGSAVDGGRPDASTGGTCSADDQCAAGQVCDAGRCTTGSATDGGQADTGPNPGGLCSTDSDCSAGESCIEGHCSTAEDGGSAPDGSQPNSCGTDIDCPTGDVCVDNVCTVAAQDGGAAGNCTTDADCAAGEFCVANRCVAADGGAGSTDSGLGFSDGGIGSDASDAKADVVCAAGLTQCGSACVDLTSDTNNCGACSVSCPVGETCVAGACT